MPHDDQVQQSVPVVVAPGAAQGPVVGIVVVQSRPVRHVRERPVAIVPEQHAGAVVGQEQVLVAVVVVVGGAAAGAYAVPVHDARLRRHLGERPAAVVAVQGVGTVRVGQIDVVEPVPIIIENDDTPSQVNESPRCGAVQEVDPRGGAGVRKRRSGGAASGPDGQHCGRDRANQDSL